MYAYIYDLVLKDDFLDVFDLGKQQGWAIADRFERGVIISLAENNRHWLSEAVMSINSMSILFAIAKNLSCEWFEYFFDDGSSDSHVWRWGGDDGCSIKNHFVYTQNGSKKRILAVALKNNTAIEYMVCFDKIKRYTAFFAIKDYKTEHVSEKTDIEKYIEW